MKRIIASIAAASMLLVGGVATAQAPSQGGFSTDNITYKGNLPFEGATSTGVTIKGKYMYLTSWKNISIYDISDPLNPALQGTPFPIGFMFENENVAVSPGGEFLLFSESLPNDILHIYNVEDKSQHPGAGVRRGGRRPHHVVHPEVQVGLRLRRCDHRPARPGEPEAHGRQGWGRARLAQAGHR